MIFLFQFGGAMLCWLPGGIVIFTKKILHHVEFLKRVATWNSCALGFVAASAPAQGYQKGSHLMGEKWRCDGENSSAIVKHNNTQALFDYNKTIGQPHTIHGTGILTYISYKNQPKCRYIYQSQWMVWERLLPPVDSAESSEAEATLPAIIRCGAPGAS